MGESADDPLPHHFERTTGELLTVSLIGGNSSSDGNWVCCLDNGCMIATCLGTIEYPGKTVQTVHIISRYNCELFRVKKFLTWMLSFRGI